jgi:hypothetical protein
MRSLAGITFLLISVALGAQVRSTSMGAMRSGPASAASLPATSLAMTSTSRPASPSIGLNPPHSGIVGRFGVRPDHRRNRFPFARRSLFDNGLSGRGLFDAGFFGGEPVVVNQQTEPVVVEVAPPVQPVVEDPKPGTPLLIEWEGDRFVRLSSADVHSVRHQQDYSEYATLKHSQRLRPQSSTSARRSSSTRRQRSAATESQPELPPAILVFRDGRQLSIASYAIIGPTLYQSAGYWTDGYWTKKIELADLDLPATVRLNRDRGIEFLLPTAPNQIITRP